MSLYVHCDRCDTKRLVSPGVIAPAHWKVYGEQGTTLGQEFTLCPECEAGLQRWMRLEPDPLVKLRKDWFGDRDADEIQKILQDWQNQINRQTTSGPITIDGVTLVNPAFKVAGSAFRPLDSEQARVLVTFEVDAHWDDEA